MIRWTHLIGALMLVFMLWTGGTGHASEGYTPVVVAAETLGHFSNDRDEAPSDQHQGTAHHHSMCGEHHAAAWTDIPMEPAQQSISEARFARSVLEVLGREPDRQLRPPIA